MNLIEKLNVKMQRKDALGNYYVMYVLQHPPAQTDSNVWSAAVTEYAARAGISEISTQTVIANVDWPEVRRLYNRLLGEGKQRRTADSTPAPAGPVCGYESHEGGK